jgi:hypothetical protein
MKEVTTVEHVGRIRMSRYAYKIVLGKPLYDQEGEWENKY